MKKNYLMITIIVIIFGIVSNNVGAEGKKGFHKVKSDERFDYYEGSAIVSGAYHMKLRDEGDSSEAGLVCFFVHGPTERLIPRENDTRPPWFCFTNTARARSELRIPKNFPPGICTIYGKATVKISEYTVDSAASDVHDSAILDKVITYEKPTFSKECDVMR